ncbi:MAG: hypothetical protein OEW15_01000 [Nitrospirota bacterium]|nr:hypothetical protein [Nitrospirota bacterium]
MMDNATGGLANGSWTAATATVYYSAVAADGTLGAWSTTTALPQALFAQGAVVVRGRIYVAGGNGSDGNPVKTVYSAQLKSDGTLGAWSTLASLPAVRAYHSFVSVAGYLYVLGGTDSAADPTSNVESSSLKTVYNAQINIAGGNVTIASEGSYNPYNHSNAFFADSAGKPHVIILGGSDVGSGAPKNGVFVCTQ